MNQELMQLTDSARQVVAGLGLAADERDASSLVAELGWLMVSVPEERGGLGMGLAGATALYLELGRGLATTPFLSNMQAIEAVAGGQGPARSSWLEFMMAGERQVASSMGESSLSTERSGDGVLTVNGRATAVPSADAVTHMLIEAGSGCIALLALDLPGVTITERPTWDTTRRLFDVELVDVALDQQAVLAEDSLAETLGARLAILRDLALAADSVGGAEALLDMTVEYLQTRQQFGRPLALFQALKHRCADLKSIKEGAQALLQDSIESIEDASGNIGVTADAQIKARCAKQLACSAYAQVAEEALQLHGGIGMTSEHDCHLFLKRALLNEHLGGSQERYEQDLAALFIGTLAANDSVTNCQ